MFAPSRTALCAIATAVLTGCAGVPTSQALKPQVREAIQPVDLTVGIPQPELYATFEPSTAGVTGAAACGAVPGLGILLAAVCGGVMGSIDAGINATRAKEAEDAVRPLKDQIVDVNVDQAIREAVQESLRGVPGMQIAGVTLTKQMNDKAYEETFRASTANAVMFVNIDYHLSTDFSFFEVSARSSIHARGNAARTAAGQPTALPAAGGEPLLSAKNAVYRADVIYQAKLPVPGNGIAQNIAAWKANDAQLLRTAINSGIAQLSQILTEDLQRSPGAERPVLGKVDGGNGIKVDLLAQSNAGQLLRHVDGTLRFTANLAPVATADAGAQAARITP
jgi:hypothetical protein